jgi:hypothetical protein
MRSTNCRPQPAETPTEDAADRHRRLTSEANRRWYVRHQEAAKARMREVMRVRRSTPEGRAANVRSSSESRRSRREREREA